MFIFLISFLFSVSVFACDFVSKIKSVYSLSGPVTLAFRDLKLISNPKLKGISVFHPVSAQDFKGEFLPGGIFLSHQKISSLGESVIFFDESRELSRIFSKYPHIKAVEIKTRGMLPEEVLNLVEMETKSYLKDCNFSPVKNEMQSNLRKLKSVVKNPSILFFLGSIKAGKYPEILMVQDGVVKWLLKEKLIQSYPSELPYVNWSSQIMQRFDESYKVGIKDSGNKMTKEIQKQNKNFNLTYPGALIPGTGQVEAILYLFENI